MRGADSACKSAVCSPTLAPRAAGWATRLAVGALLRSLCQPARAPHAYSAAPVRGREGRVVPLRGVQGKARSPVTYCSLQRRLGRVPGFTGAYHHRQYTAPLCLGVRGPRPGPSIAELRNVLRASRVACETQQSYLYLISFIDLTCDVTRIVSWSLGRLTRVVIIKGDRNHRRLWRMAHRNSQS